MIAQPLSAAEIRTLVQLAGGVQPLLSRKSPKYRQYQDLAKTDEDWIALMATEPRLIKRPLVRVGDDLYIGFDEVAWRSLLTS
ncbi:MAG: arsenate reductase [Sulfobacillus acidophilus]|uniref:Arsenate reductase n=1 Tax=Sulfobacillus acidophilus TaxID=53633 RepID=A0A2T2WI62_9FIRM|nr:MAG: arsenate reductase [Sulfobacillus acidophilus]